MNKIFSLLLIVCIFSTFSCNQQTEESKDTNTTVQSTKTDSNDITVYYFHSTRRCMTCKAIEENAKTAISSLKNVNFKALDFTDAKNYDLAKKYGIVSSSLIIESKDKQADLTDFAFQNAIANPKALKDKIKGEIKLLSK
ncbi:MAG: nitrophenyl compound nitroreductase subunit ArsF family protein [Hyphomicrobiales bacterium]